MITLVLGGARSGKSQYGESIIESMGGGLYLATSRVWDTEMAERVKEHQTRRTQLWQTVEAPIAVADEIIKADQPVLLDCLTLWLSNLMEEERDISMACDELIDALKKARKDVVLISNEVGLGIVPDNALARKFRDLAGRLNQDIAAQADRVVFVAAGLPLVMKDTTTP